MASSTDFPSISIADMISSVIQQAI
jgi:hypothetical protein